MAKTLATVTTEVQTRLGDTAASLWSAAEIQRYLIEGYSAIAFRTHCFWKEQFINDAAATANITAEWERQYVSTVHGVFTFTGGTENSWEREYVTGPLLGPSNHTADWEATNGYAPFVGKAVYELPSDLIQIERATWDNYRIDPLNSAELQLANSRYLFETGNPRGYLMDGDGLRKLRKWPIPSASATGTTSNFKIEFSRQGSSVSDATDEFELPGRYSKYLRHYACWRCLEREGKGQDLPLANFWKTLYEAGIGRMLERKRLFRQRRIVTLKQFGRTRTAPPLARLPWQYGRVVG